MKDIMDEYTKLDMLILIMKVLKFHVVDTNMFQ